MRIEEPTIRKEQILILDDENFCRENAIIVTGCGSGIGRAVAVAAAANGLTTAGLDVNVEKALKTCEIARRIGADMTFFETDLSRDDQIVEAVKKAASLGSIRYLANIAGMQHIDSVANFPMEKYDLMMSVMLRAAFLLSKLAIPHMKKNRDGSGVVANMGSVHAHVCTMNKPVYNIAKFGLRALSQSISAEGEGKIRSFTVSTGFVKTPLALEQIPDQARQRGITPEAVVTDIMMGKSRIKEMMSPVEVANLFIFGFSKYASYLVGGDMLFDGGMVLTY